MYGYVKVEEWWQKWWQKLEIDDIVKSCQKGESKAQEQIYRHFYQKMFGVCLYYSANPTEAQDHLQDGFVHLFNKIGKFEFKGSFEGWMRRLFVNLILQKYRKKKLLYTTGYEWQELEEVGYEHIVEDITATDLLNIIQELSPQYRLVFNLYAIEGYSHKEIAEELGISEGTSKSNLSRARGILQEKVVKRYPDCYQIKSNGG